VDDRSSLARKHRGARVCSEDIVDAETRSRMMRAVRQEDTRAELRVRRALYELGIRYRVRNNDLPGSPDVANRAHKWAIFVNGCFWHGHKNCTKTKSTSCSRVPRTRADFWSSKFAANRSRDAKRCRELRRTGYKVLFIWECELVHSDAVTERLPRFCDRKEERKQR